MLKQTTTQPQKQKISPASGVTFSKCRFGSSRARFFPTRRFPPLAPPLSFPPPSTAESAASPLVVAVGREGRQRGDAGM